MFGDEILDHGQMETCNIDIYFRVYILIWSLLLLLCFVLFFAGKEIPSRFFVLLSFRAFLFV